MSGRRNIPVRVLTFSQEDQERLLEETILEWRDLGPSAAWDAIYDILGCWFEARGLDPEAQRVDRTHIEIRPVPWLTARTRPSSTKMLELKRRLQQASERETALPRSRSGQSKPRGRRKGKKRAGENEHGPESER
jgi:hypothetical protein